MHAIRWQKIIGVVVLAGAIALIFTAPAAEANFLLLLNKSSVSSINHTLEILATYIEAENGLKIVCSGGSGSATLELANSNLSLLYSLGGVLTGCSWFQTKTCTINDEGEGNIYLSGEGETTMSGEEYITSVSSEELAVVYTEGVFCTIPEEEVISGTFTLTQENPLDDTSVKLERLDPSGIDLGGSAIIDLVGDVDVRDQNPSATFAAHLVSL